MRRWLLFLLMVPSLGQSLPPAQEDDAAVRARKELLPRPVSLKAGAMPLSAALAQLYEQTGNQVVDRRQDRTDPLLQLDLNNATFWHALEAIARAARCAISTYQADGQIALVDGAVRTVPTVVAGIFRVASKGVACARDDEAGTHVCTITLDVAWEPRFEPLFFDVGAVQATYAADVQGVEQQVKAAGQGKFNVAGRNALQVDVRLPAPRRSSGTIKSFEGQFRFTGPGKMLSFSFAPLKAFKKQDGPLQQTQEGVQVSVAQLKTTSSRWSVDVTIDNPRGNPEFESFQVGYWLANNRIAFEKGTGPARKVWTPRSGDDEPLGNDPTSTHAEIRYNFIIPLREDKGQLADWRLVYRTPGRIVEIGVPFAFKDLNLP